MASDPTISTPIVSTLNDVKDLVKTIKSGDLDDLLMAAGVIDKTGCSGMCGCVNRMCGCNSSVSARGGSDLNPSDFLNKRQQRVEELRKELADLENVPEDLIKSLSPPAE